MTGHKCISCHTRQSGPLKLNEKLLWLLKVILDPYFPPKRDLQHYNIIFFAGTTKLPHLAVYLCFAIALCPSVSLDE